jgi:hypothetical protein
LQAIPKVDVKVAQQILRHANSRITRGFYQQAVTDEKREAQHRVVKRFLKHVAAQKPSEPESRRKGKRVVIDKLLILIDKW